MSMRNFIRANRAEIDAYIGGRSGTKINDRERELWVLNDEGLYRWAQSAGVKV